jgi:hypothetical protein
MSTDESAPTEGHDSTGELPLGGAIEMLAVRDLEADVEAVPEEGVVRLNLSSNGADGRTVASVWATPARARELVGQLEAAVATVERTDPL